MKKFIDKLEKVQGFFAVCTFVALTLVVFIQVVTRWLNISLVWSEEVARFLFFWTVLMGASISVKNQRHFILQVFDFTKIKNATVRMIFEVFPNVCIFLFSALMFYAGLHYFWEGRLRVALNSQINFGFIFVAIPIAALTMMIYSVFLIIQILQRKETKIKVEDGI
jgi:TRAP-type C4-dicarboxylate transport system permease small subunit